MDEFFHWRIKVTYHFEKIAIRRDGKSLDQTAISEFGVYFIQIEWKYWNRAK